jgi:putative hydrolase of the HAD superfamily
VSEAWNAMLLDLPENRLAVIQSLKKEYSIYLLSNTNAIHISAIKKYLGESAYTNFYNLFNKVYYSHEIGFRKPNKEAFQLILKENNLKANEVLFIDDSPQHIQGAKKLGIKTYHLKDQEEITTLFAGRVQ